ncbi:oligosaccharide flippase family protein [Shimia thalassica]|uniref:oligosaccharide flippase family protein n=1 Tax=Shimia thalassica TaxID=1715693 RepID=UPI0026E2E710|nr:oligosaccharide flippase family protein [Shimia thalassica]MDO6522778.1 oligosaccharide flippase family protein [Shimia thalassica]
MRAATIKGRVTAWSVPLANELAAFVRSIIMARLLGAEELGKTMLLALVLRLVEMASDVSFERFMAQVPDGGSARLQANLQGAAVLRGVFLALVLLALAFPLSQAFTDGPTAGSYAILALAPLIRGFVHLDYRRHERKFSYNRLAVVELGAAAAMLISTPIFATLLSDYRALLGVILTHVISLFVLSHLLSERRYALAFERVVLVRIWHFGAPLILNAGLMFLTFQADRLIVAGYFSWAELGMYGIALQLALLPAQITGRAAASLLAPKFRRAIAAHNLPAAALPSLRTYAALAGVFLLAFGLAAGPMIQTVYGADFSPSQALIWALALGAAIRIARTPISQLAVSLGRTDIPFRSNTLRALAIIPAWAAVAAGAPLFALALIAAAGEAVAALRAWSLLKPYISSTHSSSQKDVFV